MWTCKYFHIGPNVANESSPQELGLGLTRRVICTYNEYLLDE